MRQTNPNFQITKTVSAAIFTVKNRTNVAFIQRTKGLQVSFISTPKSKKNKMDQAKIRKP